MLQVLATVCVCVGLILGYIVGYHVMLAAAPEYVGMWWTAMAFNGAYFLFSFLSKLYDN